jgi:hypothetical protein
MKGHVPSLRGVAASQLFVARYGRVCNHDKRFDRITV